jgi:hypothetical protein
MANMVIPIAHSSSSNSMVMQESEGEQFTDQQLDEFYNTNTTWTVPVELKVPYDSQETQSQYYGASTNSVNSVALDRTVGTPLPKDCPLHIAIKHDKEKWTKVA